MYRMGVKLSCKVASLLPAVCEGEGGIIGGLYMGCGIIPAGTGILGNSLLEK
jgi:hypothetical protein